MRSHLLILAALPAIWWGVSTAAPTQAQERTCLMFAARNLAKGQGNFYLYVTFSTKQVPIAAGDSLEYVVFLAPGIPEPKGGIDLVTTDGRSLRDAGLKDDRGLRSHGDADLSAAVGKWLHRRISLSAFAGATVGQWNLQQEGDRDGLYVQFVDNVAIVHGDGSRTDVYAGGPPETRKAEARNGYSQGFTVREVPVAKVVDGTGLSAFLASELANEAILQKLEEFRGEMAVAARVADRLGDQKLGGPAQAALKDAESLQAKGRAVTSAEVDALRSRYAGVLRGDYPQVKSYKADLVGHGHIDFQWLWNWPETEDVTLATCRQAAKFMDEFPNFHYTMSSTGLYRVVEEKDPALFATIKKRVAEGRWEIADGRITECDTNIISPESHARQFLYGQRYYRDKFGKQAVVGWEPDTFGHTLQTPQLYKLAGLKYLYICRAGVKLPLFWMKGPDGSRVLAFDDTAAGSFYNGGVSLSRFDQQPAFEQKTGQKEILWVYGVGNHGGGPTRESIEAAIDLSSKPYLPEVRFSAAQRFFEDVSKGDLSKVPVHQGDLNTIFEGCYTSHSDVKRWNRDAEAANESAEPLAALASQYGFEYPHAQFKSNWEDILWNHHHDTIGGTCIGSSYAESEKRYGRSIVSANQIGRRALSFIAARVKGERGVVAFNPVASKRRALIVADAASAGPGAQRLQAAEGKAVFYADLPSVGYAVCRALPRPGKALYNARTHTFENARYRVVLDPSRGVVTSVFDKKAGRDGIAPGGSGNRLEVHWEGDSGMSAWVIGGIQRVEPLLDPVTVEVLENGPVLARVAWTRRFQSTDIRQILTLGAEGPPEFTISTQWNELGHPGKVSPFLKVAFDVNVKNPVQTYDVPFATLKRPSDNAEYPALQWVDFGDGAFGAALVQDCKHGYSAQGQTLRLSLIRSSFDPDPNPNMRRQHATWSFMPHAGTWREAGVPQFAQAFNHPVWVTALPAKTGGILPPSASLLSLDKPGLLVTGVKLAEDGSDLVVRFYEAFGKSVTARMNCLKPILGAAAVNLLEDYLGKVDARKLVVKPYEIKTVKVKL